MPRKNPLPARQIEIGQRFKALRKTRRWSRADMQILAGIDADTCRNVEQGRAPLRYNTAAAFLMFAKVGALWLATGEGEQESIIPLPSLKSLGLPEDALFVEVFDRHIRPHWVSDIGDDTEAGQLTHIARAHHLERWFHANNLAAWSRNEWLPRVPDSKLAEFSRKLRNAAEAAVSQYPPVSPDEYLERRTALATLDADYDAKKILTDVVLTDNIAAMQDQMLKLRARLIKATVRRGQKAALAKWLKVPTSSISPWLAGRKQPSGDTTLRLLQWVEQQERQQNQSPGSATTPPGRKTRLRKSSNEQTKSGQRKR